MSALRRVGSSPEVDVAMIASGGAARLACASNARFRGSRSGALSWISSAPSTASSTVAT